MCFCFYPDFIMFYSVAPPAHVHIFLEDFWGGPACSQSSISGTFSRYLGWETEANLSCCWPSFWLVKIVFSVSLVHLLSFKSLQFKSRNMCFPVACQVHCCLLHEVHIDVLWISLGAVRPSPAQWGMVNMSELRKITEVPFPFPYSQFPGQLCLFLCTGSWQVCVVLHWYTWRGLIPNCTFLWYYCTKFHQSGPTHLQTSRI